MRTDEAHETLVHFLFCPQGVARDNTELQFLLETLLLS